MEFANSLKMTRQRIAAGMMILRFMRHSRWSREKLESFQQKRLVSLVSYAANRSPFYRELYRNIKISRDLELKNLPVIDKTIMMENFDRFVTDPRIKLDDLQLHIRQIVDDEQYLGEYRVLTTSGSTGQKGIFLFNWKEWAATFASGVRGLLISGAVPSLIKPVKESRIYPQNPLHMTYRESISFKSGLKNAQLLDVKSKIDSMVDALNKFQPELLTTYASIASLLAIEQIEGRLIIHPKMVNTTAEVRTKEMETNIKKAWNATLLNTYGSTEMGSNFECSYHRGIHMFDDYSLFEVVDEKNQPVPYGTPGFKLLITNLFNYTQPLIRYEISDIVTISTETCSCGLPFRMLSNIEGRNNDMIYLPDNQGKDIPIYAVQFYETLGAIEQVAEYQVLQEEDRIVIHVVLRKDASQNGVTDEIKGNLLQKFETVGISFTNIDVHFTDRLDRDDNVMGKRKIIKSMKRPHN